MFREPYDELVTDVIRARLATTVISYSNNMFELIVIRIVVVCDFSRKTLYNSTIEYSMKSKIMFSIGSVALQ